MPRILPQIIVSALFVFVPLCFSCSETSAERKSKAIVSDGVVFARTGEPGDGFQSITVDLRKSSVRPVVVAQNVTREKNNFVGDAYTVREWCERSGALGGINGGFFGVTYDDIGSRKQIVQLAVVGGKVVAPGSDTPSSRTPGVRYLRSAIGFREDGSPEIAWATGTIKNVVRRYGSVTNPTVRKTWGGVRHAVACGPRLFNNGARRILDKEERLVSPGTLIRAFVAYDTDTSGKPIHFVMGRADSATYADIADFLEQHFKREFGTHPQEAMCLDGGSSGQLVYKSGSGLVDAEPTGVRVPTAILLLPKQPSIPRR